MTLFAEMTKKNHLFSKKNLITNIITKAVISTLMVATSSHIVIAKNDGFEKVIENGKTVYKRKVNVTNKKQETNEKVKIDMYLSQGCKE